MTQICNQLFRFRAIFQFLRGSRVSERLCSLFKGFSFFKDFCKENCTNIKKI